MGLTEYKFINPLVGIVYNSQSCWDDSLELTDNIDELKLAIKESLTEDTGLAEYIPDTYPELQEKVKEIKIDVGFIDNALMGIATVISEELTKKGEQNIKSYLEGQYSDGWGEGFEQQKIAEWYDEVTYDYYDEDTDEYCGDDVTEKHTLYCSFWNRSIHWSVTLHSKTPLR